MSVEQETILARTDRKLGWLTSLPLLVLGATLFLSSKQFTANSSWFEGLRFVGLLAIGSAPFFSAWILSRWAPETHRTESANTLLNRIHDFEVKCKTRVIRVVVAGFIGTKKTPLISYFKYDLVINREALDELSPQELDFGLAFELQSELRAMVNLGLLLIILFVVFSFLADSVYKGSDPNVWLKSRLIIIPIVITLELLTAFRILHADRQRRIETALEFVPDFGAAKGYFIKTTPPNDRFAQKNMMRNLIVIGDFELLTFNSPEAIP